MAGKPHKSRRLYTSILAVLIVSGAAAVALVAFSPVIDLSRYRTTITSAISQRLGIEVHIGGAVGIKAALRPSLIVEEIRIANPPWASVSDLVRAERLEIQFALLPLLRKKVEVQKLNLAGGNLFLERNPAGNPNWFHTRGDVKKFSAKLLPTHCTVSIKDSAIHWQLNRPSPMGLEVHDLKAILGKDTPLSLQTAMAANTHSLKANISGGKLGQLFSEHTPWPLQGRVTIDDHAFQMKGTLVDPLHLKAIRLALSTKTGTSKNETSGNLSTLQRDAVQVELELRRDASAYKIRAQGKVSGLDFADVEIDIPLMEGKQRLAGSISAGAANLEHFGALFNAHWIPMGPLSVTGKFVFKNNRLQIEPLRAEFAETSILGSLSADLFAPHKTSLQLGTKAFDIGYFIALQHPDSTVSIQFKDAALVAQGVGDTILDSMLKTSLRLTAPTGHLRWQAPSKSVHYEIGMREVEATSEQSQAIDVGLIAKFNEHEFRLTGSMGSLITLADKVDAFPLDLRIGGNPITGEFIGTISKPLKTIHLTGRLGVQAEKATFLAELFGHNWIYDRPVNLSSELDITKDEIRLHNSSLQMDGVRLIGEASYTPKDSPRVNLHLNGGNIDLAHHFEPKTRGSQGPVEKEKKPRQNRLIPDISLPTDRIAPLSLAMQCDDIEIVYSKVPITTFNAHLSIIDGVLKIMPYEGKSPSGSFSTASLILDTNLTQPQTSFHWILDDLDYGLVLKSLGITKKVVGKLDMQVDLTGHGLDLRSIMGSVDGEIEIVADRGRVPKRFLELWGGSLLQLLLPTTWFETDETDLNCGVYRFTIEEGLMQSDLLLVDTQKVTVAGEVALDFKSEKIAGLLEPKNKEAVLLKLGTPLKLSGTLANIKAESAQSGIVTLGKLVLGLAHPSSIILLFGDLGTTDKNPCRALLEKNLPEN